MSVNGIGANYAALGASNVTPQSKFSQMKSPVDNMSFQNSVFTKDGRDDGKISFGTKVESFTKGIGKAVKNGVKSLLTPKGFLKAAGAVAACVMTGGVAAPILAGVGMVKGAKTIAQGAKAAKNAKTDAQAQAAWENIGGGSFQVGLSAVAMKASVGVIKGAGNGNFAAGVKNSFDNSFLGRATTIRSYIDTRASGGTIAEASENATTTFVENGGIENTIEYCQEGIENFKDTVTYVDDLGVDAGDVAQGITQTTSEGMSELPIPSSYTNTFQTVANKASLFNTAVDCFNAGAFTSNLSSVQFGAVVGAHQLN